MIPRTELPDTFTVKRLPSLTFFIDTAKTRIYGMVDGLEAVKQAVYLILETERYVYPVVSWNYGTEIDGLYGEPKYRVYSMLTERISEALLQDDRIESVDGFEMEEGRNSITATFVVHSIFGVIEQEVTVNV